MVKGLNKSMVTRLQKQGGNLLSATSTVKQQKILASDKDPSMDDGMVIKRLDRLIELLEELLTKQDSPMEDD